MREENESECGRWHDSWARAWRYTRKRRRHRQKARETQAVLRRTGWAALECHASVPAAAASSNQVAGEGACFYCLSKTCRASWRNEEQRK